MDIELPKIESDIIRCKTCGEHYCKKCNAKELKECTVCKNTVCTSCIDGSGRCADCIDKKALVKCYRCGKDISEGTDEPIYECENCHKIMCENCYEYDDDDEKYYCRECMSRLLSLQEHERQEEEEETRQQEDDDAEERRVTEQRRAASILRAASIQSQQQRVEETLRLQAAEMRSRLNQSNVTVRTELHSTGNVRGEDIVNLINNESPLETERIRRNNEPGWEITDTW